MKLPQPLDELDGEDLSVLDRYLESQTVEAGRCLFEAGAAGDCCYLIDEGQVRIELAHPEGGSDVDSDAVLGYLGAGNILGELSLLDNEPRSASAHAETDLKLRRIDAGVLDGLGGDHPRVALAVYRALGRNAASKLRGSNIRLADMLFEEQDPEVDELVSAAEQAWPAMAGFSEEAVDAVIGEIAQTVAEKAGELADATVRITKIGNVHDKTIKNKMASLGVAHSVIGQNASGQVSWDADRQVGEVAAPAGVIFGMIPLTNPVATAVFKALIAIKSRNAIILSFHRAALPLAEEVGGLIQTILKKHGMPAELVQWVRERASRKKTEQLMSHPDVSLVLATGGASMVKAAYSSGTPAYGVGPGNAPAVICSDADLGHAANSVVLSKSFDNGLICGSEHNLVVVDSVRAQFIDALTRAGAAVLTDEEAKLFARAVVDPETGKFTPRMIGQDASVIAGMVGIKRDYEIRLLVVPTYDGVGDHNPFSGEKMSPMVSLFAAPGDAEAIDLAEELIQHEGTGHTAIIHTASQTWMDRFAARMPASRILVNSPGSQGVIGYCSGLTPSLTLGCGTFGGNSTTDNVTWHHLLNFKRVAHFQQKDLPF